MAQHPSPAKQVRNPLDLWGFWTLRRLSRPRRHADLLSSVAFYMTSVAPEFKANADAPFGEPSTQRRRPSVAEIERQWGIER
jgi:hypothetical protein